MKTIKELKLGFSDAQNYSQRKNKKFFNDIFVKNTFFRAFRQPKPLTLCTCGDTIEPLRFEAVLPQSSRKTEL